MANDPLREVGRGIGRSHHDVEFLKRRGGMLPSVERTRGILTRTTAFIAPFEIGTQQRRVGMSLNFYDKPGGTGCEFGELDDYIFAEITWGTPYPYGVEGVQMLEWYGSHDYPSDGKGYGTSQGAQDFLVNTGEFSMNGGGLYTTSPGFYLIDHQIAPTGVTLSAGSYWQFSILMDGDVKSRKTWSVPNGGLAPPLATASIISPLSPPRVTAIVNWGEGEKLEFKMAYGAIAFFTQPNFAGSPPHTFIRKVGEAE